MSSEPLAELTRSGFVWRGSDADLEPLRLDFDRQHWVRLPRFFGRDLLALIGARLERTSFDEFDHAGAGGVAARELVMTDDVSWSYLHFLVNDPGLFRIVQAVTGCGPIGCFTGRVYRMLPGPEHYDSWHGDLIEQRVIALTVNLGADAYEGGVLQFRRWTSDEILSEVANTGPGDAVLFRLSEDLAHRVSGVTGTASKTAWAGWFRSEPDFLSWLKATSAVSPDA